MPFPSFTKSKSKSSPNPQPEHEPQIQRKRHSLNPFSRRSAKGHLNAYTHTHADDTNSIHSFNINSFDFPLPPSRPHSDPTKAASRKNKNRSIYSSAPAVHDRESSLYPHRLDVSCLDLHEFTNLYEINNRSLNFLPLPIVGLTAESNSNGARGLQLPLPEFELFGDSHSHSSPYASRSASFSTPNLAIATSRNSVTTTNNNNKKNNDRIAYPFALSTPCIFEAPSDLEDEEEDDDINTDTASTDASYPRTPPCGSDLSHRASIRSRSTSESGESAAQDQDYYHRRSSQEQENKWKEKRFKLTSPSFLRLTLPVAGKNKKREQGSGGALSKLKQFATRSEIWSSNRQSTTMSSESTTMTTPVVPPRSALRSVPEPKTPSTPPLVNERRTSLYHLPADSPLGYTKSNTPSLSSGSGSDADAEAEAARREEIRISACKLPKDTTKKRGVVEKDPNRIRDGRSAKESSSGVYTPTTFPGAQGPRPSHFPSHVYTPPNFQLLAAPQSTSPSQSTSSSSSNDFDLPRTPRTPFTPAHARALTTKTMAGLRRISGQIGHLTLESRSNSNTSPSSPMSMSYSTSSSYRDRESSQSPRDSYFPPISGPQSLTKSASSRQSSWGPVTPTSATFSNLTPGGAGLGVGLAEKDGFTVYGCGPGSPDSPRSIGAPPKGYTNTNSGSRGKRKPVPAIVGVDEPVDEMGVRA